MGNCNSGKNVYKEQYIYYPDNTIHMVLHYKNGVLHGKQQIFTEDNRKKITVYKNGVYKKEYWVAKKRFGLF